MDTKTQRSIQQLHERRVVMIFAYAAVYSAKDVIVTGVAFGPTRDKLTIDDIPVDVSLWTSEQIKFTIPPKHPNGNAWQANQPISIGVIVQKQQSNKLPFTVS